ncbi:MAG: pantetheine-phosphate adenylyltransferase [Odoribacter sp.]|nr:pantetheine-phosphate adenylyltransferase [Odoribacter sp.]
MNQLFLNAELRLKLINKAFPDNPNVKVVPYSGLTVDFCREQGASIIIRGLRTAADFEYERSVGQANRAIDANIETVFVLTSPAHTFISSTTVRNIFMNGGNVDKFLAEKCTTEDLKACVENSKK